MDSAEALASGAGPSPRARGVWVVSGDQRNTRALLVSYLFPPTGGAGVGRLLKLAKYLPAHGVTPAVLTAKNPSVPVVDESLLADVSPDLEVLRAWTLEPGYALKQAAWQRRAEERARQARNETVGGQVGAATAPGAAGVAPGDVDAAPGGAGFALGETGAVPGGAGVAPGDVDAAPGGARFAHDDVGAARGRLGALSRRAVSALGDLGRAAMVPDPQILWQPHAQAVLLRRLLSHQRDDVVFISGPPFSQFLLAPLARARPGTAVVLDYRDEWATYRTRYEMMGRAGAAVGPWLERALLKRADAVTCATSAFRDHLLAAFDFLEPQRVVTIPNGYDPDDFVERADDRAASTQAVEIGVEGGVDGVVERGDKGGAARGGVEGGGDAGDAGDAARKAWLHRRDSSLAPPTDRFVVTYAGTVFALTSARGFLAGVRLLHQRDPALARSLEVNFIGRIVETESGAFDGMAALGVHQRGYLDKHEVTRRLAQSHLVLCLLADVPGAERIYPAKVFELLYLGRPCLTLTPPGALADLAIDHRLGSVLPPGDQHAIADYLAAQLRRFQNGDYRLTSDARNIEVYDRRRQAGAFADVFDAALRHARAPRRRP